MVLIYHEDLEKQEECGVVTHERHESHVSQWSDCYLWDTFSQISPPFKILMVEN